MKIAGIIVLSLLLIFIGGRVFAFMGQERQLNSQISEVTARLTKAQQQEANLKDDEQYLANPANLEKELRSRFNYKKPGETMIVIVPAQSSTASSTH